jgi:hypothetical protein
MAKWIKWFASFVYSSSKDDKEFTENLALSITALDSTSGWYIIESNDDIRADLQQKKERKARECELAQVGSFNVKSSLAKDWLKSFADLLLTLPEEEQEIAFNSLPADMRVSIVNRVLKIRGQQWLELIEKIFLEVKGRTNDASNPEALKLLQDLKASWEETAYEKGRLGSLRDFTMLCYTEERLSPKLLKSIHSSLVKSIQVSFRVQLQCQLTPDDVSLIEDGLALAIPDLIALHCQSAKIFCKTQDKQGKLPAKWKEDEVKQAQKVREIKAKGVDAKWEGSAPYTVQRPSIDLKEATQVLTRLLTRTPPVVSKVAEVIAEIDVEEKEPESSDSNSESDHDSDSDSEFDEAIAEKLKVHIREEERMNAEDLEHRRNFLMHTLFSAKRLSSRAINTSA